jgi:hypothetical protein
VRAQSTTRNRRPEAGIALLISIFILLLISVVAIALIVSSGTESALASNYRSSTSVYYAALAGLEEGRGRLSAKNSNSFKTTAPGFLPPPGTPLAVGSPIYIINPVGAEIVAPWDPGSTYPDTQFNQEFGSIGFSLPNPSPSTPSLSTVAGIQGPLYKWVRINAVSEGSLNLDVSPIDGTTDPSTPVFYDGTQLNVSNTGAQVLEITSLAVLPNGSQKLLQYLVAPLNLNLSFPSVLTLDGPSTNFDASGNSDFYVNGLDQQDGGNCTPVEPQKYAIGTINGTFNTGATGQVVVAIPSSVRGKYIGIATSYPPSPPMPSPSVNDISGSLVPAFQTVNSLDGPQGVVQTLTAMADQHVTGPATNLPDFGSPSPLRMVTTVVAGNPPDGGDLKLTGSVSGYGLLVVTGDLTLNGSVSWHGIILVIGQGHLTIPSYGFGNIDGAVLIARTRHDDYSLRSSLDTATFNVNNVNNGNHGFYYNSCWVQAALPFGSYKILSFHEISQ